MRIRHVLRGRCNPDNADGIIRHTYYLARAQQQLGHDVEVYGLESRASEPEIIDREGLRVRAFPRTANPFAVHPALRDLLARSVEDIDIVHIQPPHDPAMYGLSRVLHGLGIPYFLSAHAMWSKQALARHSARKRLYKVLFDDRMVAASVGVHATAAAEVGEIERYAPGVRVFAVRNSIEFGEIDATEGDGTYWPALFGRSLAGERVFVFLGRLDPYQKGLDVALDAFARIPGPRRAVLGLIGPFWRRSETFFRRRVAELGLGDQVAFTGPLFGEEKYRALRSADLYLQTSRYETSPYSIQEALACGLPAVLTRATNFAETVERWGAGLAVDLDVDDVARSIGRMCARSRGELEDMGRSARSLVEERHSLVRAAGRMVDAYQAALTSAPFEDDD